jgi:hypothetical protein
VKVTKDCSLKNRKIKLRGQPKQLVVLFKQWAISAFGNNDLVKI